MVKCLLGDFMKITSARHTYPERENFIIDRKHGLLEYTFLHFYNSVTIVLNGETITTSPHAVIFFDKKTPQYFKSNGPLLHDWFHFDGDCLDLFKNNGIEFDKIYYPGSFDFITKITSELEKECFAGGFRSEELMYIKFDELLLKLRRSLDNDGTNIPNDVRERLRNVRGEVFATFFKKWTVAEMAKIAGFSESRFFKLYKTTFGVSPTNDLINARIESAKNLLLTTELKIDEIAERHGYDNTTHFIRQFKSIVGVTPTAYRK